jgi:hypothetical protein
MSSLEAALTAIEALESGKIRSYTKIVRGDGVNCSTLLRSDTPNDSISQPNQTIHQLSIRSVLAEHENVRLKEALINERQRRERGKALSLKAEEEYHGGAVFWSPRKVNKARDRMRQREVEEEQQRLQKAEIARDREGQRQAQAHAIEVRRKSRAEARIVRQAEKARRAQQRLQ